MQLMLFFQISCNATRGVLNKVIWFRKKFNFPDRFISLLKRRPFNELLKVRLSFLVAIFLCFWLWAGNAGTGAMGDASDVDLRWVPAFRRFRWPQPGDGERPR